LKAIILAAGRGRRMNNLTDDRPKCLIQLNGRTLLEWQLEALRRAGISEIAIVTGYKREMLADIGLTEFHNPRWSETQMVESLCYAGEWLLQEPCIVSYSDIFYDYLAVKSLMESSEALAVLYDPNWLFQWSKRFSDPLIDAESFRLNPDGSLAEIGNKPRCVEEIEGQYMGLLRFTPVAWRQVLLVMNNLPEQIRDSIHMTTMLQRVIECGQLAVAAIPYQQNWGEVDTSEDLMLYENNLFRNSQ